MSATPDTLTPLARGPEAVDVRVAVETPEGVDIGLRPAGPAVRFLAWGVDMLIRIGLYAVLGMALASLARLGLGLFLVAAFLLEWLYPVFFEVWRRGATPGKAVFDLRVVHADATPVAWPASLVRNLLRAVDFLPFAYGFGLVSMLVNARFQRLGDLAADTLVVHHDKRERSWAQRIDAEAAAPPVALSADEQQALVHFAERSPALTAERSEELAELLIELTGVRGRIGVERLRAHAAWLVGRR